MKNISSGETVQGTCKENRETMFLFFSMCYHVLYIHIYIYIYIYINTYYTYIYIYIYICVCVHLNDADQVLNRKYCLNA